MAHPMLFLALTQSYSLASLTFHFGSLDEASARPFNILNFNPETSTLPANSVASLMTDSEDAVSLMRDEVSSQAIWDQQFSDCAGE